MDAPKTHMHPHKHKERPLGTTETPELTCAVFFIFSPLSLSL